MNDWVVIIKIKQSHFEIFGLGDNNDWRIMVKFTVNSSYFYILFDFMFFFYVFKINILIILFLKFYK